MFLEIILVMNVTENYLNAKMILAERLKAVRQERGLTQQNVADIVSGMAGEALAAATYKQWENGTNAVTIKWIPYVCKALSCDVGYLFAEYDSFTRKVEDVCTQTGLSKNAAVIICDNRAAGNFISAFLEDEEIHNLIHETSEALKLHTMDILAPHVESDSDVQEILKDISLDPSMFLYGKAVVSRNDALKYSKLAIAKSLQEMFFRVIDRISRETLLPKLQKAEGGTTHAEEI